MEDQIEDLWPDLNPAAIITPASILKTQASALSQKSKGLLRGEVESSTHGNDVYHSLSIVVPALDNYRYGLLRVHHSLIVYPVYIDESPQLQSAKPVEKIALRRANTIPDEASFRDWLRRVLAGPETRNILENLLAQATT